MISAKTARRVRLLQVGALILNAGILALNLLAGNAIAIMNAVCVAALLVAVCFQTRTIRLREKLERPRPDYAAIARMERRIYGETFGHAGAPPRN